MEDYISSINAVINTLQTLTIQATENNLKGMLGCIQVLQVMKEKMEEKTEGADEHADVE